MSTRPGSEGANDLSTCHVRQEGMALTVCRMSAPSGHPRDRGVFMNVNELIALLETLPEIEKQKAITLETEHGIFFNLSTVRYDNPHFVVFSMYPDPFEEALKQVIGKET